MPKIPGKALPVWLVGIDDATPDSEKILGEVIVRPDKITEHIFFTKTVTINENSPEFDVSEFEEATIIVRVSAIGGTNTPTLVPEIEISGDKLYWVHRATIIDPYTQGDLVRLTAPTWEGKIINTNNIYNCQIRGNFANWMRVGLTLGGTNPSFTLTVKGYFR